MCKSLLRFIIPFNVVVTLVAFVAADGQVAVAATFSLAVWATTLVSLAGLNAIGRNLIGRSASC